MTSYRCEVCQYVYDEAKEGVKWEDLPNDWVCPVCDSPRKYFKSFIPDQKAEPAPVPPPSAPISMEEEYTAALGRIADETEIYMADIHQMAETGESVYEPMRTKKPVISWDNILIKGAQLAKIPLNYDEPVNTRTVIGPRAKHPLVIDSPILISHMSFGAISKEAHIALAKGSSRAQTAMCSGEGGILQESLESAYKFIFEYVPNQYSATEENLKRVDAVEIKIGQSAKPGMGGHLPAKKVTKEIAEVRGFREGREIVSPSSFPDIRNRTDLKKKVDWLKEISNGKPVGVKIAAGNIEEDLETILYANPDFITIDGRAGATASAPKFIKSAVSVPSIFSLDRARKYLNKNGFSDTSLIITGGLRISPDFAKALALGADAVAIATSALLAIGCEQYRLCNMDKCPMGITTQDPALRAYLKIETAAERLANFLSASTEELKSFARLTGNRDVHQLAINDLCTTNSEISQYTAIAHV